MDVLDEDGNLFGVVNIIDVLALLFVLVVVVAGAVLAFGGGGSSRTVETTNVTLDFGQQPTYIASQLKVGDTYSPSPNSEITLTEVYLAPEDGATHVVARAEIQAPRDGDGFSYSGERLRVGRTLYIVTNQYQMQGRVQTTAQNVTPERTETTVVLHGSMAAANAKAVMPGDEIKVAGTTVATVEDVAVYPGANSSSWDVFAEVELQTHRMRGEQYFGGRPLRGGQIVELPHESYSFEGHIDRLGGGIERSSTGVVIEGVLPTVTALELSEGDVATVAGHDVARIETVSVYATQDPELKRVVVGTSLQTIGYSERDQFGSKRLKYGMDMSLDFGQHTLLGTIERIGATEPRGLVDTRNVTLRINSAQNDVAGAIQPGMTEKIRNTTIARVTDVDVGPSPLVTAGEGNSVNIGNSQNKRNVIIVTELRVRNTSNGITFKSQPLRQGSVVVIDLGVVLIEASVVSIGA